MTQTPPKHILDADHADPLAHFRSEFRLPEGIIYLDGNSLGALPAATPDRMKQAIEIEWGRDLIGSWNSHDWIGAPRRVGAKIARIVGAGENDVVVADSTSVNLFKLLVAALKHQDDRSKILSEPGNFPTDLYIAQGVTNVLEGRQLVTLPADDIIDAIDEDTAVVLLTHVHYKTGRKFDMAKVTAAAHDKGALVIWDLSHSAGAVPLDLAGSGADLAIGCGYKYLNGGPGAPAFLYVAPALQGRLETPLSGWMGHASPFAFNDQYEAGAGIDRFQCGTASILALISLEVGVDLHLRTDMAALQRKSEALSSLFIALVTPLCEQFALSLVSPADPAERGSHVSLAHDHAFEICQALIARGVVGDFRAPEVLRFGFTPLYTRFSDVWSAVCILQDILSTRAWDAEQFRARSRVT
ncbi:kynureninase [Sphingobium boeckii]|uniref:Kynureninase n=1 Tax=Sphingobium boeckii TaxID=1082345 RepID=A0A7W9AG91_9SPHN|nr:kynureninase [Sphingobium boeckii]MBB5685033.1 kynureninase [Sphingobium boeckii]